MAIYPSFLELFEGNLRDTNTLEKIFLLNEYGKVKNSLTYEDLKKSSEIISCFLENRGLKHERILLLFPSGLEFLMALLSCFYTNSIAVPLNVPNNKQAVRLKHVIKNCMPRGILTDKKTMEILSKLEQDLYGMLLEEAVNLGSRDIVYIPIAGLRENEILKPINFISLEDVAFIQYTSGSTFLPKGVVVSYDNLAYNCNYIKDSFNLSSQDVFLTWLPNYHDMGLVDGLLLPLYLGCTSYIMSPSSFLKNPSIWLKSISNYKVTHSGGPNFCYELCVKRSISEADKTELCLENWKSAYNGAEPINADTLDKFTSYFKENGFKREYIYPCYGLAEATLMVTGCDANRPPIVKVIDKKLLRNGQIVVLNNDESSQEGQRIVSSGRARLNTEIAIVDPNKIVKLQDNEIGEIWVKGPTIAKGYWNNENDTRYYFNASFSNQNEGEFLRTGDLGFINEGELYVTGRIKDIIIINGENYYPQDIEHVAEKILNSNRTHVAVVFSIEEDSKEPKIILMLQVKKNQYQQDVLNDLGLQIFENVYKEINVIINKILFTNQPIPKTSSGKIQRQICKKLYLEERLEYFHSWENGIQQVDSDNKRNKCTKIANILVFWLAGKLNVGLEHIGKDSDFSTFGIDSIRLTEMLNAVEKEINCTIPVHLIYTYSTINKLSDYLADQIQMNMAEPEQANMTNTTDKNIEIPKDLFIPDFII